MSHFFFFFFHFQQKRWNVIKIILMSRLSALLKYIWLAVWFWTSHSSAYLIQAAPIQWSSREHSQIEAIPCNLKKKVIMIRANLQFEKFLGVWLKSIVFQKFVNVRVVNSFKKAWIFDSPHCQYNIIFCRDFLYGEKMRFCFNNNTV